MTPVTPQRKIIAVLASHTPERMHREGVLSGSCTGAMCLWKAPAHTYGQGLDAFNHAFALHLNDLIQATVRESAERDAKASRSALFKALALEVTTLNIPEEQVRGAQAVSLWLYDKGKQ